MYTLLNKCFIIIKLSLIFPNSDKFLLLFIDLDLSNISSLILESIICSCLNFLLIKLECIQYLLLLSILFNIFKCLLSTIILERFNIKISLKL